MKTQLELFGKPENLCSLSPQRLRSVLQRFSWTPNFDVTDHRDVGSLTQALVTLGKDAPSKLLETLSMVADLATWEAMDALLAKTKDLGAAWVDDNMTPADVVVDAWLRDPRLVEREHARRISQRVRKFEYFQADPNVQRDLTRPDKNDLLQMAHILNESFVLRKRGRKVRIVDFEQDDTLWFVIWHGGTMKLDRSWENGEMGSVRYRPAVFDVVVYEHTYGELRVSAKANWQQQLYRSAFGTLLFGSSSHFPGTNKYTLEPLVRDLRAALTCVDVDGLELVTLRQLELAYDGASSRRSIEKADDLLTDGGIRFPPRSRPVSARFGLKTYWRASPRMLTISPSNIAQFTVDEDRHRIELWMRLRGYARKGHDDDEVLETT